MSQESIPGPETIRVGQVSKDTILLDYSIYVFLRIWKKLKL